MLVNSILPGSRPFSLASAGTSFNAALPAGPPIFRPTRSLTVRIGLSDFTSNANGALL